MCECECKEVLNKLDAIQEQIRLLIEEYDKLNREIYKDNHFDLEYRNSDY